MAEATVIINGNQLTDSQSAVLKMAMSSFESNLAINGSDEVNTNIYRIISAEILQIIENNEVVDFEQVRMAEDEAYKARNKAIYEAIEIKGESVESQIIKYSISRASIVKALRLHKLEMVKTQSKSGRQPLINDLDNLDSAYLNQDINILDLSPRSSNALRYGDINTISDLIQKTDSQLLKIVNLGITSLTEIKRALNQLTQKQ